VADVVSMKQCSKCRNKKSINEFNRNRARPDGLNNYCRSCDAIKVDDWSSRNPDKVKERGRRWKLAHPGEDSEKQRRFRKRNPGLVTDRSREERLKHPDRVRARKALIYAIATGKIKRPKTCEDCGKKCKPHGHHEDYSKPMVVSWLCSGCHQLKHLRQRQCQMSV